jgi:hypothetical protein
LGNWVSIDGRAPTAFTRDFGELVIAPEFSSADWFVRPYAGVSYSTLVRPDDLARWGGLFGGEIFFHLFPGQLFGRPAALYAAVHNALEGNPDPAVTSSFEAGIHVGGRQGAAVRLFAGFFNGNEVFHQYYKERMQYWTMGIAFEVR